MKQSLDAFCRQYGRQSLLDEWNGPQNQPLTPETVTIKAAAGGNCVLGTASTTFPIRKAAAPALENIAVSHKYTVTTGEKTIRSTIPADAGALSFIKGAESTTGSVTVSGWSVDAVTGKVAYTLSGGAAGDTVTLPVTVTSTNYADAVVNVVITLTERDDQAALRVTKAGTVVYGQTLTLGGTGGSGTGAVTYRIDTTHSTGEAVMDPNTDTVTVDVSGLQNVHSAKLPASIVEKAEQSGAELTVALPAGSVTLDAAALAAAGSGRDVTVSVQQTTLTDAQRAAVGSLASCGRGRCKRVDGYGKTLRLQRRKTDRFHPVHAQIQRGSHQAAGLVHSRRRQH